MRLGELREELEEEVSEAALRGRLADLTALGAIAKSGGGMPYAVRNELTDVGLSLLRVVDSLDAWLSKSPEGSIPLGSGAAKVASKALAEGWRSKILDAIAVRPLSLTQLDEAIADLSYPAIERRVNALRNTGIVEAGSGEARTPYRIARWGSEGMRPLAAAARFELLHMPDLDSPLTSADLEMALLIAGPVAESIESPEWPTWLRSGR